MHHHIVYTMVLAVEYLELYVCELRFLMGTTLTILMQSSLLSNALNIATVCFTASYKM